MAYTLAVDKHANGGFNTSAYQEREQDNCCIKGKIPHSKTVRTTGNFSRALMLWATTWVSLFSS